MPASLFYDFDAVLGPLWFFKSNTSAREDTTRQRTNVVCERPPRIVLTTLRYSEGPKQRYGPEGRVGEEDSQGDQEGSLIKPHRIRQVGADC